MTLRNPSIGTHLLALVVHLTYLLVATLSSGALGELVGCSVMAELLLLHGVVGLASNGLHLIPVFEVG